MTAQRVLVIGAHHGVGAHVVRLAHERGLSVTPFDGDVLDAAAVEGAMAGNDVVISTLGPRAGSPPDLCARGMAHIVAAMRSQGVRRLVQVTGAMIGHPHDKLGLVYRLIARSVPADALADRHTQERLVRESGLDWTLVRPTRLTDGASDGALRDGENEKVGAFAKVSREAVARYLLQVVDDRSTQGRGFTLQS